MAIAFEPGRTGSAKVTVASTTGPSFNIGSDGGTERIWIALGQQNATTGVTVDGNSATEVPTDSPAVDSGYYVRLFYYDNPGAGTHTVAVTWGTAIVGNACAAVYSGTATGVDSHNKASNNGSATTPQTGTTTVVASNCWLIMATVTSNGPNNPFPGANTYSRSLISDSNTIALGLFDSSGTVGTGSQSLIVDAGAAAFMASVIASFAPAAAPPPVLTNAGIQIAPVNFT